MEQGFSIRDNPEITPREKTVEKLAELEVYRWISRIVELDVVMKKAGSMPNQHLSMERMWFVESHIDVEHERPFPFEAFPNTKALCLEIIPKMSRSSLLRCVDKRLGTSGRPHPPEAQFQDEFYRVLTTVLGRGVTVSSEWSYDKQGRIDFRIVDPGWGIELLRDGDRLAEHCERFLPGGTYYPWISGGLLKEWIILDFRHSHPQKSSLIPTNLWRIVLKDDYSTVCIVDGNNETILPEYELLN